MSTRATQGGSGIAPPSTDPASWGPIAEQVGSGTGGLHWDTTGRLALAFFPVTISGDSTIRELSIRLKRDAGTSPAVVRLTAWRDNGGTPGAILCQSAPFPWTDITNAFATYTKPTNPTFIGDGHLVYVGATISELADAESDLDDDGVTDSAPQSYIGSGAPGAWTGTSSTKQGWLQIIGTQP